VQRGSRRVAEQINPTGQIVHTRLVVGYRDRGCEDGTADEVVEIFAGELA